MSDWGADGLRGSRCGVNKGKNRVKNSVDYGVNRSEEPNCLKAPREADPNSKLCVNIKSQAECRNKKRITWFGHKNICTPNRKVRELYNDVIFFLTLVHHNLAKKECMSVLPPPPISAIII